MARAAGVGSARTLKVTALVGAIAVLSLLDWHLYTTALDIAPLAPDTRAAASNEAKEVDLSTPLDDKPLIGFEETVQRPLFNADRKPIVRNKEVAAAAPQPLSTGMQLVGIVKSDATPGRALIRFPGEPVGKWVPEGETINGWHVTSVKTVSIVLEGNGQTHELKLQSLTNAEREKTETANEPRRKPAR